MKPQKYVGVALTSFGIYPEDNYFVANPIAILLFRIITLLKRYGYYVLQYAL
jgi:hypothetical protein